MENVYTLEQLHKISGDNYSKLVECCKKLEDKGFWERVRKITNQSCLETLDLYVQSGLAALADSCDDILEKERKFLLGLTDTNPLAITEENGLSDEMYLYAKRVSSLPPILIQLCGLYDNSEDDDMTKYFLDSYLNILMCMSFLNKDNSEFINAKIEKYCERIESFVWLSEEQAKGYATYVSRKIHSVNIKSDVRWLISPGSYKIQPITVEKSRLSQASRSYSYQSARKISDDKLDIEKESENLNSSNSIENGEETENSENINNIQDIDNLNNINNIENLKESESKGDTQKGEETIDKAQDEEDARASFEQMKQRLMEREREERLELDKRVENAVSELKGLTGLSEVKEEVRSLINLIKIRNMRRRMDMPVVDMSYHMVFTGAPGTGKTTVARIVARVYKELGILSKGTLVETDRSGLVAGYVGQTAINVRKTVDSAMGGVLFIDEAYSLAAKGATPNDFGNEAIDTLVKLMEDRRDDLVVIVAGYTSEMQEFLEANTGLKSRFNKFIEFRDYTDDELIEILSSMAEKAGYEFEDDAFEEVKRYIISMSPSERREFGNARGVRNVFERIMVNQANRIIDLEMPERADMMCIKAEDVQL